MVKKQIFLFLLLIGSSAAVLAAADGKRTGKEKSPSAAVDGFLKSPYVADADKAADFYLKGKEAMLLHEDREQAEYFYEKALEIDSLHPAANFELAEITPDVSRAIGFSRRAHEADPDNKWFTFQLSGLYIRNKEVKSAIGLIRQMIDKGDHSPETYRYLTSLYYMSGDYQGALDLIDTLQSTIVGENEELAMYKADVLKTLPPTDSTLTLLRSEHEKYPENNYFLFALADGYFRLGQDSLALDALQQAITLDPEDEKGYVALFDYYYNKRDPDMFIRYAPYLFRSDFIEMDGKIDLFSELMQNGAYFYRKHPFAMDKIARSMLELYPDEPKVHQLYARHLFAQGEIDQALNFYKSLAEQKRGGFEAYRNVMDLELYKQEPDSILMYSRRALFNFPDKRQDVVMARIGAYLQQKNYRQAIHEMQQQLRYTEGDSLLSVNYGILGDLHQETGSPKEAMRCYEKALRYNPDNMLVLNNYAYLLSEKNKKLEKALTMIVRVVDANSSNATYLDTYGWILYKLGRPKEAREVMAKAVALDTSQSGVLWLHYGIVLSELGEKESAAVYLKKALEAADVDTQKVQQQLKRIGMEEQ